MREVSSRGRMQFEKDSYEKAEAEARKHIGEPCAAHNIKSDKVTYIPLYNQFIVTCEKCREEILKSVVEEG